MKVSKIEPKEVFFNSINKTSVENLIAIAAVHQHPLYLCSGRVFVFEPYAQTEFQHGTVSKGIHHFYSITYSRDAVDTPGDILKHSDGMAIPLVDLQDHEFWAAVFEELLK